MLCKKIILTLFIIIIAVFVGSSTTLAQFMDEESSNHNLQEGTLNLALNNTFTTSLIFPCNFQLEKFDDESLKFKNVTTYRTIQN